MNNLRSTGILKTDWVQAFYRVHIYINPGVTTLGENGVVSHYAAPKEC